MSRASQFQRELDTLHDRRTDWLRGLLTSRRGRRAILRRAQVNRTILRLQELYSDARAPSLARKRLSNTAIRKRTWRVTPAKGHMRNQKKTSFKKWYRSKFGKAGCIYVFWQGKRCIYVGRTEKGHGRPTDHFVKNWFPMVKRITVFAVSGRRSLPALECLANHWYKPLKNRRRPGKSKWTTKCPICKMQREIRDEIRSVFRFR